MEWFDSLGYSAPGRTLNHAVSDRQPSVWKPLWLDTSVDVMKDSEANPQLARCMACIKPTISAILMNHVYNIELNLIS